MSRDVNDPKTAALVEARAIARQDAGVAVVGFRADGTIAASAFRGICDSRTVSDLHGRDVVTTVVIVVGTVSDLARATAPLDALTRTLSSQGITVTATLHARDLTQGAWTDLSTDHPRDGIIPAPDYRRALHRPRRWTSVLLSRIHRHRTGDR
ncbi:hypothetical protein [Nocardia blacklockiae]|uniref:hypothetical protein n=1 Tax=Nocardia blacklockiae TaxID=480036 RepID=UPI001894A36D|nr:hypothetical protein [Nocardia blacklockiae]MBF6171147.1 hypothetical protein [Nocardia blacklockiae]